jgi:D-arabinose 1-dehydrogenase-like Zn-dependent alcohol dehydrogenase
LIRRFVGSLRRGACGERGVALQFATRLLARGGKVVVTGLFGGNFSIAAAMFGIMAITIEGTLTGTLTEAQGLLDLARAKNIAPIPTVTAHSARHRRPSTIYAPAVSSAARC